MFLVFTLLFAFSSSADNKTEETKNRGMITFGPVLDTQFPAFFPLLAWESKLVIPFAENFSVYIPARLYYESLPAVFSRTDRYSTYFDLSGGLGIRWIERERFGGWTGEVFLDVGIRSGYNVWQYESQFSSRFGDGSAWLAGDVAVGYQMIADMGFVVGGYTGSMFGGYFVQPNDFRAHSVFSGIQAALFVGYAW